MKTPQVNWTGPSKADVAKFEAACDAADAAAERYCALYEAKQRGEQVDEAELAHAKREAARLMGNVGGL